MHGVKALAQAGHSAELRFKVGDQVQANVGSWTRGVIRKLWDEGNAYRIELDDGDHVCTPSLPPP